MIGKHEARNDGQVTHSKFKIQNSKFPVSQIQN
jgi:hypothetical protein